MYKICHVCNEEKEHASYKSTTCNECIQKGFKWCKACNTIQPITNFGKNGKTIRSVCKPCENKRSIENKEKTGYYKKPEVRKRRLKAQSKCRRLKYANNDVYRHEEIMRSHNRRCIMQQQGFYSITEWNNTLNLFKNECAYCGSKVNLTVDHIVPISKSGKNTISNIIPACSHCNSSKCAHDMTVWYKKQKFFNEERLMNILKYIEMFKEER